MGFALQRDRGSELGFFPFISMEFGYRASTISRRISAEWHSANYVPRPQSETPLGRSLGFGEENIT